MDYRCASPLEVKPGFTTRWAEFTRKTTALYGWGLLPRMQQAYLLKKARLWNHVAFCGLNQSDGNALPARVRVQWNRLGHGLPPDMPAGVIRSALLEARIDPRRWVIRSPREELLRSMHRKMIS
jgi:hypothetical protein